MSTETKKQRWSPGLWEVRDRRGRIYVTDPGGIVIAQITSGNHADARLFVAAPPMAEALAAMVLTTAFTSTDAASYELGSLSRDEFDSEEDFARIRSELIALVVAHRTLDAIGWRWP